MVTLSTTDIEGIEEISHRLLSVDRNAPLHPWAEGVFEILGPLLRADRMFIGVPLEGEFSVHQSDADMADAAEAYVAYFHKLDLYMGPRRRALGIDAFVTDMIVDSGEQYRSEIWNDWVVPHRLMDPSGIALDVAGLPIPASLNVYHERPHSGGFGQRGLAILRLLTPTFRKTVGLLGGRTARPDDGSGADASDSGRRSGVAHRLTRRQLQVARLLARRLTNKEIAVRLCLSPHTVRRHTEAVLRKFGASSRRDIKARLDGRAP